MAKKKSSGVKSKRLHKHTVSFNEKEFKVVCYFIDKYKIKNKAKFFRESIIATILQKVEEDHPTLF
jgi:nickel-dependent lactate racemase